MPQQERICTEPLAAFTQLGKLIVALPFEFAAAAFKREQFLMPEGSQSLPRIC